MKKIIPKLFQNYSKIIPKLFQNYSKIIPIIILFNIFSFYQTSAQWINNANNLYFNNGNIGIGEANPSSKLHIWQSINDNIPQRASIIKLGYSNQFYLPSYSNAEDNGKLEIFGSYTNNTYTNSDNPNITTRLLNIRAQNKIVQLGANDAVTVLSNGNVGIGTTPSIKLDINGNIKAHFAGESFLRGGYGMSGIQFYDSPGRSQIRFRSSFAPGFSNTPDNEFVFEIGQSQGHGSNFGQGTEVSRIGLDRSYFISKLVLDTQIQLCLYI